MVGVGSGFYIHIPDSKNRRILHAAVMISLDENSYTAKLEESELCLEADQELFVYYDSASDFMQQAAIVEEVGTEELDGAFRFVTTSKPMSAESRQTYRVSTVMDDIFAEIDGKKSCRILDVSSTGVSFLTAAQYTTGKILDISLPFLDYRLQGKICVQSCTKFSSSIYRYGANIASEDKSSREFEKGLQKICIAVQRQQLQRLAGVV